MISVVVATYNGEKYIVEQLMSIMNQTQAVDEVVICDDGSKDNTVNIVEDFICENNLTGWYLYRQKENIGYSLNFLSGIFLAKGDYIFISDQDDLWYENKVSEMLKIFEQNSDLLSLSSRYNIIDNNNKIIENPGIMFVDDVDDGSIIDISTISQVGSSNIRGCAMCIKKDLKNNINQMKLDGLLGHDWLLNIIACLMGSNKILNKCLFGYRFHGNNVSLSAVSRKNLIGDYEKRINGLVQSIQAYEFLLENKSKYNNFTSEIGNDIIAQIDFEKLRLKYLKSNNPILFLKLGGHISRYARYYGSKKGGIKIWLGDLSYANHKITSKIKK